MPILDRAMTTNNRYCTCAKPFLDEDEICIMCGRFATEPPTASEAAKRWAVWGAEELEERGEWKEWEQQRRRRLWGR